MSESEPQPSSNDYVRQEPEGLTMSLEDMMKKSHSKGGDGWRQGNVGKSGKTFACYNCKENFTSAQALKSHKESSCTGNVQRKMKCYGCQELFGSNQELMAHKQSSPSCSVRTGNNTSSSSSVRPFNSGNQRSNYNNNNKRSRNAPEQPKTVIASYTWLAMDSPEESLVVGMDTKKLMQIFSNGNVVIDGSIEHTRKVYTILNVGLKPLKMRVSFEGAISEAPWKVQGGNWSLPLEGERTISAFPKREWPGIRVQLKSLPEEIPLGIGANPAVAMPMAPMFSPLMAMPMMMMMAQLQQSMMHAQGGGVEVQGRIGSNTGGGGNGSYKHGRKRHMQFQNNGP